MERFINMDLTEKEAWEVFANRWIRYHWKRSYIPLFASLLVVVIVAILFSVKDASAWISVPILLAVIAPGFFAYAYSWRQAGKAASAELESLQEDL